MAYPMVERTPAAKPIARAPAGVTFMSEAVPIATPPEKFDWKIQVFKLRY